MKRFSRTLGVLMATSMLLVSCLSDNDSDTTLYSDMAITSFTLGSLNRYTYSTSSTTGNDTVIKTKLTGSAYPMTIDQMNCLIYNHDPLPIGTDTAHVVCTVTTKNNGVVTIKAKDTDEWKWHSSSDSFDFSSPRLFRVYAIDGSGYRDYTVSLNVSETQGVTFGWKLEKTDAALAGWTDKRLVAFGDTVLMVDEGIITRGSEAFRINAMGFVEQSGDMEGWAQPEGAASVDPQLKQLVGSSTNRLYALGQDGRLKASVNGNDWTEEQLDEDAALLPQESVDIVCLPYSPVDSTDYVLLIGDGDQTDYAAVWRKLADYSSEAASGTWVYMSMDNRSSYRLPKQGQRSMASYGSHVLSVGSDMTVYVSRDQGNTWRIESAYQLPAALNGTQVIMTTAGDGTLWVLTNEGQLWHGYDI